MKVLRPARYLACCRAALCVVASSAAPAWAQPALPAPSGLQISWQGPPECERGDELRAKVARMLSGSQQSASEQVQVNVTVRQEQGSRYVAKLETRSKAGGGIKRLEGESCEAVALASAVVIALSIDPSASLDAETVSEPPPAEPRPKPRPKPRSEPPLVRRSPPPAPRVTFPYLHGSIGVLFELLDKPSAFTSAGVGARHRRLSLELAGAVYQPRDVVRPDRPTVGAELRLVSAELLGCYAALPFQLGALELCPGARLEYLSAAAFGVTHPDDGSVLLGSGLAVARGRLRATSWLSATLDAGVAARPFHPSFVLVGVGNVFDIPVFSPFARTGLVVEF
jgi:hypothetical protein